METRWRSFETSGRLHEDAMDLGTVEDSSRGGGAGARFGRSCGSGGGSLVEPAGHVEVRERGRAGEPHQFRSGGEEGIALGGNHYFGPYGEDRLSGRGRRNPSDVPPVFRRPGQRRRAVPHAPATEATAGTGPGLGR